MASSSSSSSINNNNHHNNHHSQKNNGGNGNGQLVHNLLFPAFANSGSNETYHLHPPPTAAAKTAEHQQLEDDDDEDADNHLDNVMRRGGKIVTTRSEAVFSQAVFSQAETEIHDNRAAAAAASIITGQGGGAFSEAETEVHDNFRRSHSRAAVAMVDDDLVDRQEEEEEEEQGMHSSSSSNGRRTRTRRRRRQGAAPDSPSSSSPSLSPLPPVVAASHAGEAEEEEAEELLLLQQSQQPQPAEEMLMIQQMGLESPPKLPRRPFCIQNRSLSNTPAIGGGTGTGEEEFGFDDFFVQQQQQQQQSSRSMEEGQHGNSFWLPRRNEERFHHNKKHATDDSFFLFMQQKDEEGGKITAQSPPTTTTTTNVQHTSSSKNSSTAGGPVDLDVTVDDDDEDDDADHDDDDDDDNGIQDESSSALVNGEVNIKEYNLLHTLSSLQLTTSQRVLPQQQEEEEDETTNNNNYNKNAAQNRLQQQQASSSSQSSSQSHSQSPPRNKSCSSAISVLPENDNNDAYLQQSVLSSTLITAKSSSSSRQPPPPSPGEKKCGEEQTICSLSLTQAHLEAQAAAAAESEDCKANNPLFRHVVHVNYYNNNYNCNNNIEAGGGGEGGMATNTSTASSSGILSTASEMGTVIGMEQRLAQIAAGEDTRGHNNGSLDEQKQQEEEEAANGSLQGVKEQEQQQRQQKFQDGEEIYEKDNDQVLNYDDDDDDDETDEDLKVIRQIRPEEINTMYSRPLWEGIDEMDNNDDDDDDDNALGVPRLGDKQGRISHSSIGTRSKSQPGRKQENEEKKLNDHHHHHHDQPQHQLQPALSDETQERLSLAIRRIGSGLSSNGGGGGSGSDAAKLLAARSFSSDHDPSTPRSAFSAAQRSPNKMTTTTLPYFPTSHYAVESSSHQQQQPQQNQNHPSRRQRDQVNLSPRTSRGRTAAAVAAATTEGDPNDNTEAPTSPPTTSFILQSPGSSGGGAAISTKATAGQRKNEKNRQAMNTKSHQTHLSPRFLGWNNNNHPPASPRTPLRQAVTSGTALPNIGSGSEQKHTADVVLASPSASSSASRNPLQLARACFSFDGYYNNPTLDDCDEEFHLKPISRSSGISRHQHHHSHERRTATATQSPTKKDHHYHHHNHSRDQRSSGDSTPQQQHQILASLSWDVGSSGGSRKGPSSIHRQLDGKPSSAFRSAPYTRHQQQQQQQQQPELSRSAFDAATPERPSRHSESQKHEERPKPIHQLHQHHRHEQQHTSPTGRVRALAAASDFSPTVNKETSVELKTPQRIEIEREDALDILACLVERGVSLQPLNTTSATIVGNTDKGEGGIRSDRENGAIISLVLPVIAAAVQELRRVLLKTHDNDSRVKQEQRVRVFDELVRSHEYALEMSRAAQSASSWLKSIGRSQQQESGIAATNESVEVVESFDESIPSGQETGGIRVEAQSSDEESASKQIDLLAARAIMHSSQLELMEKSRQMERLNEELAKCRAEIGRLMSVSQTIPFKSPNRSILDMSDDVSLNEDDDEEDDVNEVSDRKGGDDEYLDASFPTDNPLFDVEASNQKNVAMYQSALDQANDMIRKLHGALKDSAFSLRNGNGDIPDEPPVVLIDDEKAPRESYSPGNKDEGMVNVHMLDGENFSTEWDKLVPPLPPPPDHDLRSPIVQSFLEQWTVDTGLHDSLLSWMEQVLSGSHPSSIPPLAISSLNHQVRDGLIMHVLPLLLRRPDIKVDVKTRAHRRTTYDLAVSIESIAPPPPPPAFGSLGGSGMISGHHHGLDSSRLRHLESISALSDVGGGPGSVAASVTHSTATALISNGIASFPPQYHKTFFPSSAEGGGTFSTGSGGAAKSSRLSYDEMAEDLSATGHTSGLMSALGGALGGFLTRSGAKAASVSAASPAHLEPSSPHKNPAAESATMSAAIAANVAATTSLLESPRPYASGGSSSYYINNHHHPHHNMYLSSPVSDGSDSHDQQHQPVDNDYHPTDHGNNDQEQHQEQHLEPYHRVVSAPPGRIGVTFVEYRGHAMVSDVAANSPLEGWIFPSDILIAIDELPVSGMRVRDIITVLRDRNDRQRALRIISSHAMNEFTTLLHSSIINGENHNESNTSNDNNLQNTSIVMPEMAG